jgi:hypothetical protein
VGILSEDDPVELLEGQIMIMAPIGENHRTVVDALAEILTDQRKTRYRVGVQNPLRIDDENESQPDLVLYNRDVVGRHPTPSETSRKSKGGLQPGIDLDNTAELLNILDQATQRGKLR